jgi:hypothetical protein
MLFEQGDMLTKGSCDPLASKSGAINRLYTLAFRKGFEARDTMNQYLRQLSVDTLDATMKTWITQSIHV